MSNFEFEMKQVLDRFDKENKIMLADEISDLVQHHIESFSMEEKIELLLRRPLTEDESFKIYILDKSGGEALS